MIEKGMVRIFQWLDTVGAKTSPPIDGFLREAYLSGAGYRFNSDSERGTTIVTILTEPATTEIQNAIKFNAELEARVMRG